MHLPSLDAIAIIITIISTAIGLGMKVGAMQAVAKHQGDAILHHTDRLDKYESRLVDVVSQVQRMIGRLEATQERLEKSTGYHRGEGDHG